MENAREPFNRGHSPPEDGNSGSTEGLETRERETTHLASFLNLECARPKKAVSVRYDGATPRYFGTVTVRYDALPIKPCGAGTLLPLAEQGGKEIGVFAADGTAKRSDHKFETVDFRNIVRNVDGREH